MRCIRTWLVVLLAASAVSVLAGSRTKGASGPVQVPPQRDGSLEKTLLRYYTKAQLQAGTVVGSEFCLACHGSYGDSAEWRHTNHAHALRKPMGMYSLQPGEGILADYDKNGVDDFMQGLDFNTISSALDSAKPNAPILSYNAADDTYWIQLGPGGLQLQVVATWAGMSATNGQRYMVRIPVSDSPTGFSGAIYFGPFSWSGSAYSSNLSNWYNGNTPKYAPGLASAALVPLQGQNYLKNCSGCHITGVRATRVTAAGEYVVNPFPASLVPENSPNYPDLDGDGLPDLANIGCESCHGPGSAHILGGGDPSKIVNPADITNNQQRSVTCLQCHVQITSAPNKVWGFTFDEVNNKGYFMSNPPAALSSYQISKAVKWPDGVHYQYERIDSYVSSAHYSGSHGIACNDCHNSHAETSNPAQVRDKITRSGVTDIPASVHNPSFCLSCHAGYGDFAGMTKQTIKDYDANFELIRAKTEEHGHHPYMEDRDMGLANCISCHMAPRMGHTFIPARPEDTLTFQGSVISATATGNPNACATACHRGNVRIWQDTPVISDWTNSLFGTADEVKLADHLVNYYGPGGTWWNTTPSSAPSSDEKP